MNLGYEYLGPFLASGSRIYGPDHLFSLFLINFRFFMHYINYIEIFIELSYHFLYALIPHLCFLYLVIKILRRVSRGLGPSIMIEYMN
jgi:hypothetical protein